MHRVRPREQSGMPSHGFAPRDISLSVGGRGMSDPFDQRPARILVKPFVGTPLHPNHLTGLSLLLGVAAAAIFAFGQPGRSEEHTSELQSLMRISYAVFCL